MTSVTTAAGTYPLTITGTTGAITGTATVNLVVTSAAGLQPIGIDFNGSTPVAMSTSEVAGVVPMSNWNSAAGAASTVPLALLDTTGTATGGTVTWTANNVWMLPTVDQPGDRRMMKGYLDSANTSTTTVSVARLMPRTYDVYVYVDGDNRTYDRPANYTLSGPGLTPTTIKVIDPASTNFSGTFTQAANAKGNYLKFTVTGGDFTLTATPEPGAGSRRAPVNALEIVPVVAAPPPPLRRDPMTISSTSLGAARSAWTPARSQAWSPQPTGTMPAEPRAARRSCSSTKRARRRPPRWCGRPTASG